MPKRTFTQSFFKQALDSLAEQIAVVNEAGIILFVNQSWINFGVENGVNVSFNWLETNYLESCGNAAIEGDSDASIVVKGINDVIKGRVSSFTHEYPCHSPTEKRWFILRITPFIAEQVQYFIVVHQDITRRKLVEKEVERLATIDGLTGIANRRKFDDFYDLQWKEHLRNQNQLSVALIDIDNFKEINDNFGHVFGDQCLKSLSSILANYSRRPCDLTARFGGDEFVIILGQTDLPTAITRMEHFMADIERLNTSDLFAEKQLILSVSIGVSTIKPKQSIDKTHLITKADGWLYNAKSSGRNQIAHEQ
ncbi:diguanylate cyclase [Shewanella sp. A14]